MALLGRVFFIACLLALSSCGGGGGGGGGANALTGSLTVAITGLPNGVDGAVTIAGPSDFSRSIAATVTLADLPAGSYTITAANVLANSVLYTPQPGTQTVSVAGGATASATVAYTSASALRLGLQEVAGGLSEPLFLTAPAADARLFIIERPGRIRIVQNGVLLAASFLDISTRVDSTGEGGLLSLAFDPQYPTNGFFFIYFTDSMGNIAIERFQVSATNPNLADTSPLRILTIAHPIFTNHYGGMVAFGTDGFLYLGTGDGGGAGDPSGNAQNLDSLLGKLLRIDVRGANIVQPYVAPNSNPFFNQANRRAEIWAYGLRNPWRYAFDASLLYIADVGQARREEINVASTTAAGLNYGWNITEGSLCYPNDPCNKSGLTLPLLEYDHDGAGGCSITGGYVYRGNSIPELQGRYFYSDFCAGWLRSFVYRNGVADQQVDWSIANVGQIFSFGQDGRGELYMLSSNGKVYRIVRQ